MTGYPGTEDEARRSLCRAGAELYRARLLAGTAGNLSVRLDGDHLLVTPSGGHKGRLRPEELVRLPLRDPPPARVRRASGELAVHRLAYLADPGIGAVVHTHAPALTAAGLRGLNPGAHLPEIEEAVGTIAIVPYAPSGSRELGEAVGRAVEDGARVLLLERHGAVSVDSSPDEARDRTELAELAARAVLLAEGAGGA